MSGLALLVPRYNRVSFMIGEAIGPYQILAELGRGGMGEVYQARDTTLDRDVAIKILPPAFASDVDRLSRLEREAKLLAALNHPNIAAVYALERIGDRRVLVMELVPGSTLAERLEQGGLPLDEALPIARQIARALEAAHAKTIIHRDLKPANIKITPDGAVKLLDFGLAKAFTDDRPGLPDITNSPTMGGPTMPGMIMGTASYMSPEQARGRATDARTDIWAFGCVLFEMLTGRQAFPGETVTDTLAAIVRTEPEWTALPRTTETVRSLLRRCLQKDPDRRLHHIADARIEIEEAIAEPIATTVASGDAPKSRSTWTRYVPWAIAAASIAVAAWAASGSPGRAQPSTASTMRLDVTLPETVELFTSSGRTLTISPDGRRVAFVGQLSGSRQVYIRGLDQFESTPLRGSDGATSCFFSADDRSIAFMTNDGTLRTISLGDGLVSSVASDVRYLYGGSWGADNSIVFNRAGALWRVPAAGGQAKQLSTLDTARQETTHAWPFFLPDAKSVLFASITNNGATRIELLRVDTGDRQVLVERGTLPMYAPSGHLVFFRDNELLAAPFDTGRRQLTGSPIRVVDAMAPGNAGVPVIDVSASGSMVYSPTTATGRLVWVTRQGSEQPLNDTVRGYANPRLTPDGRQLAVQSGDLWLQDLTRATFTRLTTREAVMNGFPIWTADGRRVVFRTLAGLRWLAVDGSGRSELIAGTAENDYPGSVAPDDDMFVFLRSTTETSFDIYAMSMRDPKSIRPIVKTPAYEGGARLSPDGRWMAYVSNETGQMEVYVRSFPASNQRWQVSTQGGTQAVWNPNSKEIFYRNGGKMMVVAVDAASALGLKLSEPRLLFERRYAFGSGITMPNYDVSPDGQRFVMVKDESNAGRVNIVLNWSAELTERIRTKP